MKRAPTCLLLLLLSVSLARSAPAQEVDEWQPAGETTFVDTPGAAPDGYTWWASSEFLVWWTKDGPAPLPVLTTAPTTTPASIPGALDQPDTTVLLGGREVVHPAQLGGRFTLGGWLAPESGLGVEGNFLFLSKSTVSTTVTDNGSQFLTNPFTLFITPGVELPAANFLTIPGYPNFGSATFTSIRQVYGAELNALWSVREGNGQSWQLLGGYRYLHLNEELSLATAQRDDIFFFPGEFVNTIDQFQTRNDFHGGQLGIRGQWTSGAWFFGSTLKLALGSTHQVVDVQGATTTNAGPFLISEIPVTTVPGGIYTQPTNIGTSQRDRFAVLPEVSLRLGVQITSHVRIFTGYDFLYLSNVVRPGNQMDGAINPFQLVSFTGLPRLPLLGDPRPEPRFQTTDFWAQGLMLGAEIVW